MENLNNNVYEEHPSLRLAYDEGKLAMLEEIRDLANTIMIRSNTNPFNPKADFEQGQVDALSNLLEGCAEFEKLLLEARKKQSFDA